MRVLGFCTLGLLLLLHFVGAATECSMTNPCLDQLGENEDYRKPAQLLSPGGEWTVNMTVDIGTLTYGWLQLTRRLYNGDAASGPTLRLKKGDLLTLNLINNLSPVGNDNGNGENEQNFPNTTNLHTHGLHISGESPQDSVVIKIDPRDSHQYRYQIHPHHSSGTYWYHAHVHGSTIFQVSGGLAGILIVDDDPNDTPAELRAASCPWNCENDLQLIFQPLLLFNDNFRGFGVLQQNIQDYDGFRLTHYNVSGGTNLEDWLAGNIKYFTTNGQLKPRKKLFTGEMYRFRMVNAGGGHNLELSIMDQDGEPTSKCEVREIAIDGIYLHKPRKMPHDQTLLVAGSKADWLVRCDSPGTYILASTPMTENYMGTIGRYEGTLLTLEVSAGSTSRHFPWTLPCAPPYLTDQRVYKEDEIKGRFVVELATNRHLNREHWSAPDYYRYAMVLGEPQEWHFVNADSLSHPLHIHVNHYQVISYNQYTGAVGAAGSNGNNWNLNVQSNQQEQCHFQHANYDPNDVTNGDDQTTPIPVTGLARAEIGEWRDVLLVPSLSNITVRFTPTDFTGDVILHCHILDHEDGGMMMIVKAVNPGENTYANIQSGDAYPGTCQLTDRYPFNNSTTLGGDTDDGGQSYKGGKRGWGTRPHASKKDKRRGVNRFR